MTEEEGEKWGLVPTHAYAVLDIREYKVVISIYIYHERECREHLFFMVLLVHTEPAIKSL